VGRTVQLHASLWAAITPTMKYLVLWYKFMIIVWFTSQWVCCFLSDSCTTLYL